ncbi:hypothetical protein TH53_23720 [Pedobacter lusitanus]|uniref:Uncharacterized protein n=1 Tax=Pedobacter lusitanus TaxID=1503925 RepID=A0A0D0GKI7_9SPHI|nr:hypothetical protein TH53_23720 [Pedobacter lusitanus]
MHCQLKKTKLPVVRTNLKLLLQITEDFWKRLLTKSGEGTIIFTNSDNGPKLYTDLIKAYLKNKGQAIIDIEIITS